MPTRKLNLILIPEKGMTGLADFLKIAEIIKSKCTDVVPHVSKRRRLGLRQLLYVTRPSLYVAFYQAKGFTPLRGLCLRGEKLSKSGEYLRMEESGLETIQWQMIKDGERYDATHWGPYVIVKPDEGCRGHDVRIRKTGRVKHDKDCQRGIPHLIQKFIHTGPQPVSYRALTLFGEILYLQKSTNTACGNELNNPARAEEMGGHNPVATAAKGRCELVVDDEVIAYARKIALTAFPEVPVLGQDIARESSTGRLYCLEVNSYGSTWHFSSKTGLSIQADNNFHFESQFNAFEKTADILIRKARELAR